MRCYFHQTAPPCVAIVEITFCLHHEPESGYCFGVTLYTFLIFLLHLQVYPGATVTVSSLRFSLLQVIPHFIIPTKAMGFHLLPDSLHKRIFAVFPLQHRLQLRQVSPHWKHLIEGMCTELTSLKVFGCKADVREYCSRLREVHWEEAQGMALKCPAPDSAIDDDLVIAFHHFEAACTLLPRLFPELRHIVCFFHLQLYRYEAPDGPVFSGSVKGYFRHVPLLLAAYRNTLTALTIGGRMTTIQSDRNERNTPQLVVDEINQMTALERLDLQVENHFSSATTNYHLTRSIGRVLPHLKHFSLSDSCHGMNVFRPDFSDAIAALGPECTHISLDLLDYHPELVEAFKSHPDLPSTLTHLHLSGQIAMYQVFLNCLEDFTSLQYLYVKTV